MRPTRIGGALLLAFMLLLPSMASAGRATINDKADILTSQDEQGIEGYAAQVPFDVHVITQKGTGDRAMDDATLQRSMNGSIRSNAVVIGISLGPNIVNVKYGVGTNIPPNSGKTIQDAGLDMLRARQWGEATGAMLRKARGLQMAATATPPPQRQYVPATPPEELYQPRPAPPPPREERQVSSPPTYDPPLKPVETSDGHPVLWTLLILALLGGGAWFVFFRRRDDGSTLSSNWSPMSRGYEPPRTYPAVPRSEHSTSRTWPSSPRPITPAYSTSPPAPVIIHDSGNRSGDLATGILLGQAISDQPRERVVERPVYVEPPTYSQPAPSYSPSTDFDPAPSRSSSFDSDSSSSSSSSSFDSSSSSSSFDSSSSSSSFDSSSSSSSFDSSSSSSSSDF